MIKTTTVSSAILGSNCWKPVRFCGGACDKVPTCKYPEKGACKAHIDQVFTVRIPKRTYAKDPK